MDTPKALRFMTINVWYTAGGPTYAARLAGLRGWIAALQPDVLALQEVLRASSLPACSVTSLPPSTPPPLPSPLSPSAAPGEGPPATPAVNGDGAPPYDQCRELLAGLGFQAVAYGAASPFWGDPSRVIGNAIAARHPIVSADVLALPSTPGAWASHVGGGKAAAVDDAVADADAAAKAALSQAASWGTANGGGGALPPPLAPPPERRSAVNALVATPTGMVSVTTTHLNWQLHDSPVRQAQVVAVDSWAAARGRLAAAMTGRGDRAPATGGDRPYPSVLLGDFNAEAGSTELRFLRGHATVNGGAAAWTDAWEAARRSAPAVAAAAAGGTAAVGGETYVPSVNAAAALETEPDRRLDYVWVAPPAPDGRGIVLRCRVVCDVPDVDGVYPSDHFGVVADLRADAVGGLAAERRRLGWSHASPHPGEGGG